MSAKDLILARIRRALPEPRPDTAVPRDYLPVHGARTPAGSADLLAANLTEYRAKVHRVDEDGIAALLARLLAARGAASVLVPPGLPPHWLAAVDATRIPDRADSTPYQLDTVDSVVTGCALAIAETGTIVLDGGPEQGRRRITLVPDHHICVVRVPGQVVDSVPRALPLLDPTRPLTWISGPSATSDIELDRVEGVHGPRTLEVVLLGAQ
ncbi:LUD domain-containing protein [Streptomyces sp. TBY4]|uniref:LutC/YkgG family protein n=1 Tax=Streptomyces sp. TBY4 TaxID=2962030 RepID=UPI0020B7B4AA|nr:LUD domain-containing protein [Streptomyces sp. TBY4]MCP3753755.1 LUD domain-containing protein [Streptomyces sp. TBY4]